MADRFGQVGDPAVEAVVNAYRDEIGKRFWRPKITTNLVAYCREFHRLAFLVHLSVRQLMAEACLMYGPEWCKETFNTPYPPFAVVIGEKCRKRLIRQHKPKVAQTAQAIETQGKEIAQNLVNLMGYDAALTIVQEGWPPDERQRAAAFLAIKEMKK